ncbi:MAG: type II toxin-antitoxin system PemK/MazF family toxin [Candidatus Binatia bacterium]
MKRGDVVAAVAPGAYGKPRPYVLLQSDTFNPTHDSFTVAPLTTHIVAAPLFRITIEPSSSNGLRAVSQVMIDKLVTLPRAKLGPVIGELQGDVLQRVSRSLGLWLGLV